MAAVVKHIRVVFLLLEWMAIGVAALLAAYSRDPLLLRLRPYGLSLVYGIAVLIASIHVIMCLRRCTGPCLVRSWALLIVGGFVVLGAAYGEENFQAKKRAVLEAEPGALQRVGRHLVVGYGEVREIASLVKTGAVGGVFITRRNAAGKSSEELQMEIQWLQNLYANGGTKGRRPLLVATDQEGGIVSRLSPPLEHLPTLADWIAPAPGLSEAGELARAYGEIHGRELAGLGVNLNLSPVVDLKEDREVRFLDFYSQIPRRAIAPEPERVAAVALAYAKGLESQGVLATGKHFPGLGSVEEDTHLFSARVEAKTSDLEHREWLPFRALAKSSNALLMLSHAKLAEVDGEMPVSVSRAVVQGVLRKKWGFEGLLITDDLSMRVIYRSGFGIGGAAVKALNAGVDLLLVAYDGEKAYEVLYALLEADKDGKLDAMTMEASRKRFSAVAGKVFS
jgi:beta-N-acetylhexosaminidase